MASPCQPTTGATSTVGKILCFSCTNCGAGPIVESSGRSACSPVQAATTTMAPASTATVPADIMAIVLIRMGQAFAVS